MFQSLHADISAISWAHGIRRMVFQIVRYKDYDLNETYRGKRRLHQARNDVHNSIDIYVHVNVHRPKQPRPHILQQSKVWLNHDKIYDNSYNCGSFSGRQFASSSILECNLSTSRLNTRC